MPRPRGLALVAAAALAAVLLRPPAAFAAPPAAELRGRAALGGRCSRGAAAGPCPGRPPRALGGRRAEGGAAPAAPAEDESGSLLAQSGLFLSYFGLQSTMSFYMKFLLAKVRVAENLRGVPASFMITTSQQLVGFTLFLLFIGVSRLLGRPYKPKRLTSRKEVLLVLALSTSFSLNIGLNLLSLSLVPLSLTMIIRSCTPLSTALMQSLLQGKKQDISRPEWACMSVGVFCALAVVLAQSGGPSGQASFAFFFGVAISVTSLFSGGLDFVFKSILGTSVKLNAVDTVCYMALPVAVFTSILGAVLSKPVSASWAAVCAPRMTDLAVFTHLWQVNPAVFKFIAFSGVLAFCFNTFVTFLIVKLSPATAAFAGNFNKAATIMLSLVIFGELAPGPRGLVILLAVLGNIVAFTTYNVIRKRRLNSK